VGLVVSSYRGSVLGFTYKKAKEAEDVKGSDKSGADFVCTPLKATKSMDTNKMERERGVSVLL
jgi:hypothetical protein